MTLMKSPAGEERDIAPAGVQSLSRLGWQVVEQKKSKPETARRRKS